MPIQYEIKEYASQNINGDKKAVYAENKNGKKDGYVQNNNKKRKLTRNELENMLKPDLKRVRGPTLLELMDKHLIKPKPILYKDMVSSLIHPRDSTRKTRKGRKKPNRKVNKTRANKRRNPRKKS